MNRSILSLVSLVVTMGAGAATAQANEQVWLQQYFADSGGEQVILDEHANWHHQNGPSQPNYGANFIEFHRHFIRRYDEWRQARGIPAIPFWNPETPIPGDVPHAGRRTNEPNVPRPGCLTWKGGSSSSCGGIAGNLANFPSLDALGRAIDSGWHGRVHTAIGGDMADAHHAPRDPIFWRWHKFVDSIAREFFGCGEPGPNEIVVFQLPNFGGRCSIFTTGRYPRSTLFSIWNDSISSVRRGSTVHAVLWQHAHYEGMLFRIVEPNQAQLGFMDDRTSSIEVAPF